MLCYYVIIVLLFSFLLLKVNYIICGIIFGRLCGIIGKEEVGRNNSIINKYVVFGLFSV